jgi:hypothetical protein
MVQAQQVLKTEEPMRSPQQVASPGPSLQRPGGAACGGTHLEHVCIQSEQQHLLEQEKKDTSGMKNRVKLNVYIYLFYLFIYLFSEYELAILH